MTLWRRVGTFFVSTRLVRTAGVGTSFVPTIQRIGRMLLCMVLCSVPSASVLACGYHDPDSLKIGPLNWFYPDSLHVTGAIQTAQRHGRLPGPDIERLLATGAQRRSLDAAAFRQTEQSLHRLGAWIGDRTADADTEQFALVLVETGLWTRFSISRLHQKVSVDMDGPGAGELVVVTGVPVLHALVRGSITLSGALESGLVKLYGEPEQIDGFVGAYGTLGGQTPALAEN